MKLELEYPLALSSQMRMVRFLLTRVRVRFRGFREARSCL